MNVKLIIPHGPDSWSESERKTYIYECICTIVERWKDTTTMPGVVFWINTDGDVIEKDVTVVSTFLGTLSKSDVYITEQDREWWINFAMSIQCKMEKEFPSVCLEFSPTEVIYIDKESETKEEDWCNIDIGGEA